MYLFRILASKGYKKKNYFNELSMFLDHYENNFNESSLSLKAENSIFDQI